MKETIGIMLLTLAIGACLLGLWYITASQYRDEPDMLKEQINNKQDVSDEYRQGWNDCIDFLIHERMKAVNMTRG